MQLLTGPRVWATIAELSRGAKRTRAAVSRMEEGASELLPLKEGSALIVDLSPHALAQGQTSPNELLTYLDRGVEIFRWNGLNANVFLFDRTLVLGSATVSHRSARGLTEAVVRTADPAAVAEARAFLDSVAKVLVTDEDCELAKQHYRKAPPPPRTNDGNPVVHDLLPPAPYRLWLCEYADQPWPKRVFETYETEEAQMSLRLGDRRRFLLYAFLLWGPPPPRIEEGDVVVCAWCEQGAEQPQGVWPPAAVIGTTPVRGRGREGVIVYAKYPRSLDPVPWEDYRAKAAESGIRLRLPLNRAVRSPAEREVLLAPWGLG